MARANHLGHARSDMSGPDTCGEVWSECPKDVDRYGGHGEVHSTEQGNNNLISGENERGETSSTGKYSGGNELDQPQVASPPCTGGTGPRRCGLTGPWRRGLTGLHPVRQRRVQATPPSRLRPGGRLCVTGPCPQFPTIFFRPGLSGDLRVLEIC